MNSVLIVTLNDARAQQLQQQLERAGDFQCAHAATEPDAIVRLGEQRFDCLVVDHHPPDVDGLSLLQRLEASRVEAPKLFLAPVSQVGIVVSAMRAGASDFLTHVEARHEGALSSRIREVIEHHRDRAHLHARRYRDVLYSFLRGEAPLSDTELDGLSRGDASRVYQTMAETMNEAMVVVDTEGRIVFANQRLLEICQKERRELVGEPVARLFDDACQTLAFFVNRQLREKKRLQVEAHLSASEGEPIPVLVSQSPLVDAHDTYVGGLLVMTDLRKLKRAEQRVVDQNRRLRELANQDGATKLPNHRRLHELLDREFRRAKRYDDALSCLMLDLDYFKTVNDLYGHQFGDIVLAETARRVQDGLRELDVAGRYGGEEFLVIMPHTDLNGAYVSAERIRLAIECTPFEHQGRQMWVTASIGLATFDPAMVSHQELIARADQAVYQAKAAGRNRVFAWSEGNPMSTIAVITRTATGRQVDGKIGRLVRTLRQIAVKTMQQVAAEVETLDGFDGLHGQRVGRLSAQIAERLGLHAVQTEMIAVAGQLHDVGKLAMPPGLLGLSRPLTEGERALLRRRGHLGQQMLRRINHLDREARLVGFLDHAFSGDPDMQGLTGEAIPIGARILAVADAFDSLTHPRPYRPAQSADRAIATISEKAGGRYDPVVVSALQQVVDGQTHLRVLHPDEDGYYSASA